MGGTRRTKADPPRGEARRWSARAAAVLLGLLTAAPAAAGPASEQPGATGKPAAIEAIAARLEQKNGRARLIFETSAAVAATAFAVADPPRIVVDLPEIAFRIDPGVGQGAASRRHEPAGLVRSFRFGQFAPGRSRIVVDLARPAAIVRAESEGSQNAPRLVIELEATDEARFAAAAARARPAAPVETAAPPARPDDKPVLVIDPGHGGVDVGATGAHGEQEKTIVLDFARALKAKLEATGRLRVVLTREDDVFVALDERVRAARAARAPSCFSRSTPIRWARPASKAPPSTRSRPAPRMRPPPRLRRRKISPTAPQASPPRRRRRRPASATFSMISRVAKPGPTVASSPAR
ncbi:hypothetical protein Ms3S1_23200 [Methylosinus sp. 3S-1]